MALDMHKGEHEFVVSGERLNELCQQWMMRDYIAVDTEFMRTNTFYAKLGLLQISDGDKAFLIDPLAIDEWSGYQRLCESETTFILHSCSEDLSVLLSHFSYLPKYIFDTQLAIAFLGEGASLSYAALVKRELDVEVDKGATRTDWLKRPLDNEQCRYAALDVAFLIPLQKLLSERLRSAKLDSFFVSECERLLATAREVESETSWALAYLGLNGAWKLKDKALAFAQKLCLWRETEARRRDKPKSWVAKDADLSVLAAAYDRALGTGAAPSSFDEFLAARDRQGIERHFLERNERALNKLLLELVKRDAETLRAPSRPLDQEQRKTLKRLQAAVERVALERGVGVEVLARKKQLLAYMELAASSTQAWPPELSAWKRDLLEKPLRQALSG